MHFAIYSCNGFGREIAYIARHHASFADVAVDDAVVFVDDDPAWHGQMINGIRCISFNELILSENRRLISVAVAAPHVREKIVKKCEEAGLKFGHLISPDHKAYDSNTLGEGAILCGNTLITSNVRIGRHFHLNIFAYVAHDCVIGDFVTFAPGVRCNGRVEIDDYAYIGTNAVFKQGEQDKPIRVGKGAVVGMGAVVTKDVPAGGVVVGNPARLRE